MQSQTLKVLVRAKEILEEKEWIQGALVSDEHSNHYDSLCEVPDDFEICGVCLGGALDLASRDTGYPAQSSYLALQRRIVAKHSASFWGVPSWNDRPERTKEEVLVLLDEAIDSLQSKTSTSA